MIVFFRRFVFHNFALKLLSLGLAVLLWIAVSRDPKVEVAITVPIEFEHVPDNLEIATERIPETQIRARGPASSVRRLVQTDVHAIIDLSNAKPGERTYDLSGPMVHVPADIEVVQIVPAQLHLVFDRQGRKEVPIRPRVIGLSQEGRAHAVTVDPPTALIIGPEKRVEAIGAALTDAVDLTGAAGQVTFPGIHVYVTDPLVRVARPSSVTLTLPGTAGIPSTHAHPAAGSH